MHCIFWADAIPSQFDDALTDLSNWLSSSASHQDNLTNAKLLPFSPFMLAYRAGNHVQLLSRYSDLVANDIKPVISITHPQKKIRMAVVSAHFYHHSVWNIITQGLLTNLGRTRFELILYYVGNKEDQDRYVSRT